MPQGCWPALQRRAGFTAAVGAHESYAPSDVVEPSAPRHPTEGTGRVYILSLVHRVETVFHHSPALRSCGGSWCNDHRQMAVNAMYCQRHVEVIQTLAANYSALTVFARR
jgi:hypothetical protein